MSTKKLSSGCWLVIAWALFFVALGGAWVMHDDSEDHTPTISISIRQQIDELTQRVTYLETQLHERTMELKASIETLGPRKRDGSRR